MGLLKINNNEVNFLGDRMLSINEITKVEEYEFGKFPGARISKEILKAITAKVPNALYKYPSNVERHYAFYRIATPKVKLYVDAMQTGANANIRFDAQYRDKPDKLDGRLVGTYSVNELEKNKESIIQKFSDFLMKMDSTSKEKFKKEKELETNIKQQVVDPEKYFENISFGNLLIQIKEDIKNGKKSEFR